MIKRKNEVALVYMIIGGIVLFLCFILFFTLIILIKESSGTSGFTIFEILELFPLSHLILYLFVSGIIIITIANHFKLLADLEYSNRLIVESNNKLLDSNILILQELIKTSLKEKEQI